MPKLLKRFAFDNDVPTVTHLTRLVQPLFVLGICTLTVSGCVSSTLGSVDTQPTPQPVATSSSNPSFDPAAREAAVADIRAKADAPGSGELTNAFVEADNPTADPFTQQEQSERISGLEQAATSNENAVTDAELAARQQSIRDMRSKANSHYKDAVQSIEKSGTN